MLCVRKKRLDTIDEIEEKSTYLGQWARGRYIRALYPLLLSTLPAWILGRPMAMGGYDSLL